MPQRSVLSLSCSHDLSEIGHVTTMCHRSDVFLEGLSNTPRQPVVDHTCHNSMSHIKHTTRPVTHQTHDDGLSRIACGHFLFLCLISCLSFFSSLTSFTYTHTHTCTHIPTYVHISFLHTKPHSQVWSNLNIVITFFQLCATISLIFFSCPL